MMEERRYGEEESKKIFEAAATAADSDPRSLSSAKGLTLAELQEIGVEVGLAPEQIADAVTALELRRNVRPPRTSLGMPISVGRTIDLPRAPTDREWEMLVGELRETFNAQGKVGSSGNVRQWINGNLHAYIEPTEAGYRLRLGTLKGNASALNILGLAGMGMGMVLFLALGLAGIVADGLLAPLALGAMGVATFVSNLLRLPRWAHRREEQMEYIAARAQALLELEPDRD